MRHCGGFPWPAWPMWQRVEPNEELGDSVEGEQRVGKDAQPTTVV